VRAEAVSQLRDTAETRIKNRWIDSQIIGRAGLRLTTNERACLRKSRRFEIFSGNWGNRSRDFLIAHHGFPSLRGKRGNCCVT